MPAALTVPQAQPTFSSILDVEIVASAERPVVNIIVIRLDQNGATMQPQNLPMTPAAFFAAISAASGNWKSRVYTVALARLALAATVT